jgi:hypothetical protein
MYTAVLIIHSWIRWIALVTGFGATLFAYIGDDSPQRPAPGRADRWGLFLTSALDLQMLLGLVLYLALSPNIKPLLENLGAAMKDPAARFWAVEHVAAMFGAVVLAHVGRVLARKAATPSAKRRRLLICFGLATALMLAGIPWPGRPGGRPLFRL